MADNALVKITNATRMLAEARTLPEFKKIADLARAAQTYAKAAKLGEEAEGYATEIRFIAMCEMGRILKDGPKAKGGQPYQKPTSTTRAPVEEQTPTLADMGLDKKESAEAQMLASLTDEQFEKVKTGEQSVTQVRRERKAEEVKHKVSLPDAKYRVLLADPPWSYGNTQPDYHTEQRDHYPVMHLSDICSLPVKDLCEDNAVMFLWVTSPILEESFQVIKAWGFKYKTSFVWDKVKHNMGHYNSVRHEFLLVCVRGSCTPDVPKLFDSVITAERTGHSEKPAVVYDIIKTIYPHGKRLELFARKSREGWDKYGFEADKK